MRFFTLNLKTKITGMVLILFLCSILLLTLFISKRLELDMAEQIESQQFSAASYIADSIEHQVKLRINSLNAIAATMTPELVASPAQLREFFRVRSLLSILFPNGILVLSKDGKGIADYPVIPGRADQNYADREYFREVIATGKPSVGKPQTGRITKTPLIGFAVPIVDRTGHLCAVLAGFTSLSDPALLGTVEKSIYRDFRDRLILVSPQYSMIITGSDPSRILTPAPKTGINPLFDKFMAGFEGSGVTVNSRGIAMLASAKRVPTPGWFVRIALPTEIAYAPILRMKIRVYSIALGLSLLSSLLVWLIIRQALHPLYTASRLIRDMTEKRLPLQNIPVTQHDEIGQLLTSFNIQLNDRKEAETALQMSEKMLKTIIDTEPECVKILDENANLIMMNPAGLNMLQVESLDQVKGQCVCPLVTSEYRTAFMDLTKRVFRGETGTLVFEIVGTKGRHLWLETHAVPLRNERDEITALLGMTRDVTERKQAEEAARQSEQRYSQLFNSIRDAILVTDKDRAIIDCNPAFTSLFGYRLDEIKGRTTSLLFVHHEQFIELGNLAKIHSGKSPFIYPIEYKKKNGETFPGEVAISFFTNNENETIGFIGLIKDITERKQVEAKKRELEEEMQKLHKLESIGTLAGGIAHDFNNLLQGVFGFISLAKLKRDDREKSLVALESAEKALHLSVKLTNQLLTFSKGGKPAKNPVDLPPIIENAAKFALSGSRSSYQIMVADGLCPAGADEGQISQVIQNIVLNADQAMPDGGRVMITMRNVHSPGRGLPLVLKKGLYVEIAISDTGIGIPEQYLSRVFDPYFTTKEKGSGLGLATSYSIIKNHNGAIDVKSALGKGTTFIIYLPATTIAKKENPDRTVAVVPGRSGRVLVMDDEQVVRDVAGALISELGHQVKFALHGQEAVEKYHEAQRSGLPFDIVILDLTVRGGMGGAETLRRLLEIDPGVKAVVSSGYSEAATMADYREQGFKAFLKKPYNVEELQEVLISLLNS